MTPPGGLFTKLLKLKLKLKHKNLNLNSNLRVVPLK